MNDDRNRAELFYQNLPVEASFHALAEADAYASVPEDWHVGCADIVGSTKLIDEGRYKTVNTIGAAVISAQLNAHEGVLFPYSFGGDGAAFIVPPAYAEAAKVALAATRRWALDEFDIELRGAMATVADIREAGTDLRVARFRASSNAVYAMFSGGGISWLDERMKLGEFEVPIAPPGTLPDLTGLSCRWTPMQSRNGKIISLLVKPGERASSGQFETILTDIAERTGTLKNAGHPVPPEGPGYQWIPEGLELEARATHGRMSLTRRKLQLVWETFVALVFFRFSLSVGGFDANHYTRTCGHNADFRKFEDGLKMTIDCDSATIGQLRTMLDLAEENGVVRYGLYEQDEAIMTCIVPSITEDDHVHFIDGASGGYTSAALQIKSQDA